jgi:hypothetical protein
MADEIADGQLIKIFACHTFTLPPSFGFFPLPNMIPTYSDISQSNVPRVTVHHLKLCCNETSLSNPIVRKKQLK